MSLTIFTDGDALDRWFAEFELKTPTGHHADFRIAMMVASQAIWSNGGDPYPNPYYRREHTLREELTRRGLL